MSSLLRRLAAWYLQRSVTGIVVSHRVSDNAFCNGWIHGEDWFIHYENDLDLVDGESVSVEIA